MKIRFVLLITVLCMFAGRLLASNTYVETNGVKIWYDFSSFDKTASVTFEGKDQNSYSYEYTGIVNIPSTVIYNGDTYSVTSIGSYAFFGCSGLTSVTIPSSVKSILEDAFSDCSGLNILTISSSVITSIGAFAFFDCNSLTSVTIPCSVTSIGGYAFNGCENLKTVTNQSALNIVKGSTENGCVAYYADTVIVGNTTVVEEKALTKKLGISGENIKNLYNEDVTVYSITGKQELKSNESLISINSLAHGTYVAVTAKGNLKFVK